VVRCAGGIISIVEELMSRLLMAVAVLSLTSEAAGQIPPPADSARSTPLVIGEALLIRSEALGELRRVNVYFPPGYAAADTTPVPVLYMPDGGLGEDFLHVAGLVQVLVGNGAMRPFLLVGIENTERRRDLTGPTENPDDHRIAPRVGGSAGFRRFIRTELMPVIAARYRTTGETAIVGESLAGLFVVETLVREPDLFDTYIAFDPSLWWNRERLLREVEEARGGGSTHPRTVFLASSADGFPELTRRLAALLERGALPGVRVRYQEFPGETHATIYHPAALVAFRAVLAPPARQPPP
jgi:predicted alpha/beta superfamily hydrolase